MKLMLSTTPVMSSDSGLKLRDLVIEVSLILGGNDNFTLTSNRWPDRSSLHPQKEEAASRMEERPSSLVCALFDPGWGYRVE